MVPRETSKICFPSSPAWHYPRLSLEKHRDARDNKTNCYPSGPYINCIVLHYPVFPIAKRVCKAIGSQDEPTMCLPTVVLTSPLDGTTSPNPIVRKVIYWKYREVPKSHPSIQQNTPAVVVVNSMCINRPNQSGASIWPGSPSWTLERIPRKNCN